jgi:hypothetical protein
MDDDVEAPSWLRRKIEDARNKVASLRDQLQYETCEWRRERVTKWLRQAEENYSTLVHWVTLT